jgi:hypothetical protein
MDALALVEKYAEIDGKTRFYEGGRTSEGCDPRPSQRWRPPSGTAEDRNPCRSSPTTTPPPNGDRPPAELVERFSRDVTGWGAWARVIWRRGQDRALILSGLGS